MVIKNKDDVIIDKPLKDLDDDDDVRINWGIMVLRDYLDLGPI